MRRHEEQNCGGVWVVLIVAASLLFMVWLYAGKRDAEQELRMERYMRGADGQMSEAEFCRVDPQGCRELYLDTLEDRYP